MMDNGIMEYYLLILILCILVSFITRMYILNTKLELSTLQKVTAMKVLQPESGDFVTLDDFLHLYDYGYNKSH